MGSEMCIRDRSGGGHRVDEGSGDGVAVADRVDRLLAPVAGDIRVCLLYTSDAADERSSVDLGGRRIIKKKKHVRDGRMLYCNEKN